MEFSFFLEVSSIFHPLLYVVSHKNFTFIVAIATIMASETQFQGFIFATFYKRSYFYLEFDHRHSICFI